MTEPLMIFTYLDALNWFESFIVLGVLFGSIVSILDVFIRRRGVLDK